MDDLKKEIINKIALNLRIIRKKSNLQITQTKLAEMSGISRVTIARIESGAILADLKTLVCLARALGVDLELILDGIN